MKSLKMTFFPVVIASLCLFFESGCAQTTGPTEKVKPLFTIDLQDGFQQDLVTVLLDNQVVYDDTATTLISGGAADRITPSVASGSHNIRVSMPGFEVQADTTLNVQDTLAVGINFWRAQHKLSFTVYRFWPVYR